MFRRIIRKFVREEIDNHLEQLRQISAAILGEEYKPPIIDCENKKHPVHFWDKWAAVPELQLRWVRPAKEPGKEITTKRREVYRRTCRACGAVENQTIETKVTE